MLKFIVKINQPVKIHQKTVNLHFSCLCTIAATDRGVSLRVTIGQVIDTKLDQAVK